jgi:hypothetical protein
MLNREQHQEAVLDIVNKVDRLITDKTVRRRFTDHIDHFCKMVEDYGQALIPHIEKVERAGEKLEENGATSIPPVSELFPPPKDWVEIYNWGKPTESEALMCDYVLLAIIHDGTLEEQTQTYTQIFSDKYDGKWFQRDKFRKGIPTRGDRDAFESFFSMDYKKLSYYLSNYPYRPRKPVNPLWWFRIDGDWLKHLERAFKHVQADLANIKPTESVGNATLKSKIKDFLWTLYEKTLKVVVDAVMERWWPK